VGSGDDDVRAGGDWHGELVGEPFDGVDVAGATSFGNPDVVAAVVFRGGTDVPAVKGMRGQVPRLSGLTWART
jgi:hypothetical protein